MQVDKGVKCVMCEQTMANKGKRIAWLVTLLRCVYRSVRALLGDVISATFASRIFDPFTWSAFFFFPPFRAFFLFPAAGHVGGAITVVFALREQAVEYSFSRRESGNGFKQKVPSMDLVCLDSV